MQRSRNHSFKALQGDFMNDDDDDDDDDDVNAKCSWLCPFEVWSPQPLHGVTCHKGGLGPWFEFDWTGRPNHSRAARHGKQPTGNA
ncbi:hypothetical protein TIFTF001_027350 [Ficus carica]|uniref:Uncharacterized protein n=1 Tax=Ficus carica TaxID=3494 RepID=A0AA88IZH1_FICCA|nr:hypothetical protein TIFTF001_027350 [Ficus carica]